MDAGRLASDRHHHQTTYSITNTHSKLGLPAERLETQYNLNTHFFSSNEAVARARVVYFKTFIGGALCVILTIFAVFPIYWGSLWRTPDHPLNGWVVDFDRGEVGEFFTNNIIAMSNEAVSWSQYPTDDVGSLDKLQSCITEERAWVAVAINANISTRLTEMVHNPSSIYNRSLAITVYAVEARNENAYRSLISPTVSNILNELSNKYALQFAQSVSASVPPSTLVNILSISPQVFVSPVSYIVVNLRPLDEPVASAATFVGLIYTLILSFYIVMIGDSARKISGMCKLLSYQSIVCLRIASSVIAYFFVSLFYSLVNLAFQIDFTRKFAYAGFIVYWMVNWAGMMAVGLALESMVTILTTRFIPFFMLLWIVSNVSVCTFPIETLPRIFRYGYAAPFYNISKAFRTIAFNTKNQIGLNFGVLTVWIAISFITLPVFQWITWKRNSGNERVI